MDNYQHDHAGDPCMDEVCMEPVEAKEAWEAAEEAVDQWIEEKDEKRLAYWRAINGFRSND